MVTRFKGGDVMAKRSFGAIADYIRETDKVMFLLVFVTTAYGCIAVMSSTLYTGGLAEFWTQAGAGFGGLVAALIISNIDYKSMLRRVIPVRVVGARCSVLWGAKRSFRAASATPQTTEWSLPQLSKPFLHLKSPAR